MQSLHFPPVLIETHRFFFLLFSEMGLGTGQAEVLFLGLSFLFCQFCIQAIVHLTMRFSKRKQGTSITQRFLHSASWDCYGSSCNIPYSLFVTQVQEENNVVWPRREGLSTFSFFLHTSLFCSFQEAITCCFSFLHACFFFFSFQNLSLLLCLSCASYWQSDLYFCLSIKHHQPLELSTDSNLFFFSYTASNIIILLLPAEDIHYNFILNLSLTAS